MRKFFFTAAMLIAFPALSFGQLEQNFIGNFVDTTAVQPGSVTVELTDPTGTILNTVVKDLPVQGLDGFVGRPKADARTGGANANQDIGDIVATYDNGGAMTSVTYPHDPAAAGGPLVMSNNTAPAATGDGFVRVAVEGEAGTSATVAWDTVHTDPWTAMTLEFPIRISEGGLGNDRADGFGFAYMRDSVHGSSGTPYTGGEEVAASGLGVGFDIWDNGGEGSNSVSVHLDGNLVTSVDLLTANDAVTGAPMNWPTVSADPVLAPLETGAPVNVKITAVAGDVFEDRPATLVGGTNFTAVATRGAPGGGLQIQQDGMDTGDVNAFYRLTEARNNQGNYIAFDEARTPDGDRVGSRLVFGGRTGGANQNSDLDNISTEYGAGKAVVNFSLRMEQDGGPADGVSVVLARTSIFGSSGEISQANDMSDVTGVDWGVAEDPNLGGSLGLGFKTFDNDEIRLKYDGQEIAKLCAGDCDGDGAPDAAIPFELVNAIGTNNWLDVQLEVTDIPGTDDASVVVMVTTDDGGAGDAAAAPATYMLWGPGGIGGEAVTVTGGGGLAIVPEPSSMSLVLVSLLGLGALRRRRR